jgi:hypothetical protein
VQQLVVPGRERALIECGAQGGIRVVQRLCLRRKVGVAERLQAAGNRLRALGFPGLAALGDVALELFGEVMGGVVLTDVVDCCVEGHQRIPSMTSTRRVLGSSAARR